MDVRASRGDRSVRAALPHDLRRDPGRAIGNSGADRGIEGIEHTGFVCRPYDRSERPDLEGRTSGFGCRPCRDDVRARGTGYEGLDEDFPDDCHGATVRPGEAETPASAPDVGPGPAEQAS